MGLHHRTDKLQGLLPFAAFLTGAGCSAECKYVGSHFTECHDAEKLQGLFPLSALLASADGSIASNNVALNFAS